MREGLGEGSRAAGMEHRPRGRAACDGAGELGIGKTMQGFEGYVKILSLDFTPRPVGTHLRVVSPERGGMWQLSQGP